MSSNHPQFRWRQQEDAWLERRIIADQGNLHNIDRKSIVADFRREFPCVPYTKRDGEVETDAEMMTRWKLIPKRVNRWIQNHKKSVLARHAAKQPQTSSERLASKPNKRHRSKNARDMAKIHDEKVRQAWKELSARVKDEGMTEKEKWKRYNAIIKEVLADEALKEKYTAMADEANSENSRVGMIQAGHTVSADFPIIPFVPPTLGATDHDDLEPMPIEPRREGLDVNPIIMAYDGVRSPDVVASPDRVPRPTSHTVQQTTFDDTSLQSIGMDVETSYNYPRYISQINEWPAHYPATPRTVEAFLLHQTFPDLTIRHAYIDTSSSTGYPLDTQNHHPVQSTYVQSSAYSIPPLPQITDDSHMDQNGPPRPIESHNSSCMDTRSTSSKVAVAAPRDMFKDGSPAGDWHLQKVFCEHTDWVQCLAFSHDGKLLASGSWDRTIRVWNVETGETVLDPLRGHLSWVRCVAFSPDDRRIISSSADCTVRIWDVQKGEQLLKFKGHKSLVRSVAFSSDGSKVVSNDDENDILIWEADSGRRVCCLEKTKYWFSNFHFFADDKFIAGPYEYVLTIWDVGTGKRVPTSLQAGSFGDLVWFGEYALYACMDGEIRRWSTRGHYSGIAITHDRKWIATSCFDIDVYLYSRDPPPEEPASVDDIEDGFRRFTLVEDELNEDLDA